MAMRDPGGREYLMTREEGDMTEGFHTVPRSDIAASPAVPGEAEKAASIATRRPPPGTSKPAFADALELALAFGVALAGVVLVNSPRFHFVSAALAVYLGLLLGMPLLSARLRGEDSISDLGLYGATSLPWYVFVLLTLLPLFLIPLLWGSGIAPTIMFAVVVAPFCEEVFFRGYMARRLAGLGMVYATVVSALLFGAFHLGAQQFQSPSSVAILVLFGLVYAPVFLITRSVYVTCAIHAAWNIFVSLSAVQPNSSLGYLSYGGLAVVLAIDLLLAIFELMRAQKRAALSEAPQEAVLEPEAFARGMDIVEGPAITSEVNSTEVVQREEGGRRARFPIGLLGFASCLTGIISWAYVLLAMNPRGPAGLALGLFATVMLLLGLGLAVVFAVTFAIRSS